MGVQCSALNACKNPQLQQAKLQMLKSQQQWVRKLIQSQISSTYKLDKYFVLQKKNQPQKGIIFLQGYYYEGQLSNDKLPHGLGLEKIKRKIGESEFYQQNFRGTFHKGTRHGTGILQGKYLSFDGQWQNGFPSNGKLLIKNENQFGVNQEYKILSLLHKKPFIEIKIILPDGSTYQGEIIKTNDSQRYVIQGFGKLIMKNEDQYTGCWKNGKFNGRGEYLYKQRGLKYVGQFEDGKKEGKGILLLNETRFIQGIWKKDKKEGNFQIKEKRGTDEINLEFVIFENDKIAPIQTP